MRIIVEGTTAHDNSYGVVNLSLANALRDRGHEVSVRPWDQSVAQAAGSAEALGFRPFPLGGDGADVVVRQAWPPSFEPARAGRTLVVQPFELGAVPAAWVGGARTVDGVLVPSRFAKRCWLQGGAEPERIWVVPNGVETSRVVETPASRGDLVTVGYVGGAIWRKGIDRAIAALDLLDDEVLVRLRVIVKLAGQDTYYRGQSLLEQALRDHPRVAARIELRTRSVDVAAMDALYDELDVLLAPYRAEGFGLPILEAMARGVVPIVPDAGPAPEFVDPSCGVLVTSRPVAVEGLMEEALGAALGVRVAIDVDTRELAQRLAELVGAPALRASLAAGAVRRARSWSWARSAEALEAVVAAIEAAQPPQDPETTLLARVRRGGAQAIGALVELGDLHGACELARVTDGGHQVLSRLEDLAEGTPDLWAGGAHRSWIPVAPSARSSWHAQEGDLVATARVAAYLAPLFAGSTHVIDVGCGEGAMLAQLAAMGVRATGIELDPVRAAALVDRGHEVVVGDALEVLGALDARCADGAFLGHIIEHFPPPRAARLLAELARVLVPGGLVVLQTPNPAAGGVIDRIFWLDATHVRPYPAEVIEAMLEEAGFGPVPIGARSLAPIAPLDAVVVGRRRPEAEVRLEDGLPRVREFAVGVVADPASGMARASEALLAQLAAAGIRSRRVAIPGRERGSLDLVDVPLGWLVNPRVPASRFVRTAWEVRGVPSALVRTLGRFEQVWAMSSFSRDVLVEAGADPERLGVWPPTLARAPDAAGVRRLRAERMPEGKVLGVLAWDGRKNPAALLRAFARARSIAGGGTLTLKVRGVEPATAERFVAEVLAGEPAAAAAVRLVVGDLEEDSLWGLYLDADVYCVPTRGEGFGLPFLEAMAAGCAVVAPEEGGHREAVNDAQWLVPGEWVPVVASEAPVFRGGTWFEVNEEALAAALAEAIANPADTRQRGLAALERAEELLRAPMPSEVLALLEGAAGGELSAR